MRTNELLHLLRFVADIDFAGQEWDQTEVSIEGCDGWAMLGEKQTFGWNCQLIWVGSQILLWASNILKAVIKKMPIGHIN